MELTTILSIVPIYIAALGLLFIPITMRIALYRIKSKISIGAGDDPELIKRMRGQANFVETVPIALFLLVSMEVLGASDTWMHGLGLTLVLGRIIHYLGLVEIAPLAFRVLGILATLLTIFIASVWIITTVLF